jgi:hypothetical protein
MTFLDKAVYKGHSEEQSDEESRGGVGTHIPHHQTLLGVYTEQSEGAQGDTKKHFDIKPQGNKVEAVCEPELLFSLPFPLALSFTLVSGFDFLQADGIHHQRLNPVLKLGEKTL